jgi:HPt (histidine-containing phosphotransfer) domain-containing protein
MTAHATEEDRKECLAAGMNDYLSKPVRSGELSKVLSRWVSANNSIAITKSQPQTATAADRVSDDGPWNQQQLIEILDDDEALMTSILQVFLAETPALIKQLQDYIDAGDADSAGRTAHAIKGSAVQIGATQLSVIAADLESAAKSNDTDCLRQKLTTLPSAYAALEEKLQAFFN